jgi:FemAB-related protein (PEP-CTERM system-associated)
MTIRKGALVSLASAATQVSAVTTSVHGSGDFPLQRERWNTYLAAWGDRGFHHAPAWLDVLQGGLGHIPYYVEASREGRLVGVLPLAFVKSKLFGRFLVSLPYLNQAGVLADDAQAANSLVQAAGALADELDVKYLELRHEQPLEHPLLNHALTTKVQMHRALPKTSPELWESFKSKLRSQIKRARQHDLSVAWNDALALRDFYHVFSRNMRDLGTPVFPRDLFAGILERFPEQAEICVVRSGSRPAAAGLLVHGPRTTQVPSASSLREFNHMNANMLLYWHLLERAVERGQAVFDFGRSSVGSSTYRFKEQWGALPVSAVWQYYLRRGDVGEMRPDHGRYRYLIRTWRRLPVCLTRWLGPLVVRGIP